MKLAANGIDIHCAIEGAGPVVTLRHSLGCTFSGEGDEMSRCLMVARNPGHLHDKVTGQSPR